MNTRATTATEEAALQEEAAFRVSEALRKLESAQAEINTAAAILSTLCYAAPMYSATCATAEKVQQHQRRLREVLEFGPLARRVCLDSDNRERFLLAMRRGSAL